MVNLGPHMLLMLASGGGGGEQAMMHGMHPSMAAFLDIQVRRGHELEDALNQIVHRPTELKKPLRVHFVGEPSPRHPCP